MAVRTIADTEKAKNINVAVDGHLNLDAMEALLESVADRLGLVMTHKTTLSKKKYPGNRHWHYKPDAKTRGTLDVTYWPDGPVLWFTVRNGEPEWVHKAGPEMAKELRVHPSIAES